MKRYLVIILASLGLYTQGQSQTLKHCGTSEYLESIFQRDPSFRQQFENKRVDYIKAAENLALQKSRPSIYVIPVVFHIIHNYGVENISDAQVVDAVKVLNRDYRCQNQDTNTIVPSFKALAADTRMEFRLASIDPNGNCTNGIDRIQSMETYQANDNCKLNQWNHRKYLNIWVVNSIGSSGVVGYSTLSSAVYDSTKDGIVILHDYVGSIGTGNPFTSRALTHEVGHFFNLFHTWGTTNSPGVACGDDDVNDTPNTKGHTSCNKNDAVCTPGRIENVQNYMEYAYCSVMFTYGQKARMNASLNSYEAGRKNLWQPANLLETGVDSLGKVVASFSNPTEVCAGFPVILQGSSCRSAATSYSWILPGSDIGTSNQQNPTVKYNTPGTYDITIIANNATGSDTTTKKGAIKILESQAWYNLPFAEKWLYNVIPGGWNTIYPLPGDSTKWETYPSNVDPPYCIRLTNFHKSKKGKYSLISPKFDMTLTSAATLSFKVSYAVFNNPSSDNLQVSGSFDCGATWVPLKNFSSASMSQGQYFSEYTPVDYTYWKTLNVPIPSTFDYKTPVMFKFDFDKEGDGNNFYMDAITLTGTTGIENNENLFSQLTLIPNPSSGEFNISFSNEKPVEASLQILDISGRTIKVLEKNKRFNIGNHSISSSGLEPGIYFIQISTSGSQLTRKLVIQ